MSITSPIPALHADGDTVVLPEGDALLLRRPHEQARIPLVAISRVLVDGRTVSIELTASPTAEKTHVHRIWDVADEAAAVAFAEAVNAALPERTEAIAGADLVTGERLYQPSYRRWLRGVRRGALIAALVVIGLCVLARSSGHPGALVVFTFGFFAVPTLALAAWLMFEPVEERYLRKHGVRTTAVRLQSEPGRYEYVDPAGVFRGVRHSVQTWSIEAMYDPRDPGRVGPVKSRGQRIRFAALILFIAVIGLFFTAGTVAGVVYAFLGTFEGHL
ncbi:hypothetical protein ABT034_01715 [Streptomyces sp. NPDC002773]|uniref:hypothetical protein n=1 Tax=Streptomyces sp. NPDC002773 TaxID=3154430 RepID=UPI003327FBB2